MRFLLTNDDGVHAPGIFALKQALEPLGEVFVVAPERPRSAQGHAITLHKPLRLTETLLSDGARAYASNGTPADCVTLGVQEIMGDKVDYVFSGINHGPNLGWDVHYSGTVSAAFEAVMIGYRSAAFSVASFERELHWDTAGCYAARIVRWLAENPLGPHTLLNINIPNEPCEKIQGTAITRQGPRQYVDRIEKRADPAGRAYYWLGGTLADHDAPAGTDVRAIADGYVSITPLQLDLTEPRLLKELDALQRSLV
ncbi:MAG TPA: 5'/3'-nucleotidase SurE [Capsulimonadaceae bacterium]|nr:5'/3'-nucleotidase SurE [Capsulimonadaceae bacterium]